ncbi:hypothetical protein [Nostoc sp.]|uniref:hypothetical protein n=1 Tax=Nostoc sp. TaxID=1180 RepID=UPI002FF30B23
MPIINGLLCASASRHGCLEKSLHLGKDAKLATGSIPGGRLCASSSTWGNPKTGLAPHRPWRLPLGEDRVFRYLIE